jgi:alpha-2-macroglobulin
VIGWDMIVPIGVQALRYEVEAVASSGISDRIRIVQQVHPVVPIRTFQAAMSQWQQEFKEPVQRPADALPDRGGVQLLVRSSLVEGMDAMRDWMRRYPYACLEQQISRAVALRERAMGEDRRHPTIPPRLRWAAQVFPGHGAGERGVNSLRFIDRS